MKRSLAGLILAMAIGTASAWPQSTLTEQLLGQYYIIQKSLASDTVSGVAASAAKLAEFSRKAAKTDTRAKAQLTAIADASTKLRATDLKTARSGFGDLSDSLIAYLKATQSKNKPPYQFYCSMVKENWLQPDRETRNPYYGSAMLTCGELVQSNQAKPQPKHH